MTESKTCPKCNKAMARHETAFALAKYMHPKATEETGELVSTRGKAIPLAVYRCPECRYLELYEA